MAARTSASSSNIAADSSYNLVKQIRSHGVAIAELNNLPSSRAVYQRNGNIFSAPLFLRQPYLNRDNLMQLRLGYKS